FLKKMYRQDKKFLANIFAKKNFQNILFQGRLIRSFEFVSKFKKTHPFPGNMWQRPVIEIANTLRPWAEKIQVADQRLCQPWCYSSATLEQAQQTYMLYKKAKEWESTIEALPSFNLILKNQWYRESTDYHKLKQINEWIEDSLSKPGMHINILTWAFISEDNIDPERYKKLHEKIVNFKTAWKKCIGVLNQQGKINESLWMGGKTQDIEGLVGKLQCANDTISSLPLLKRWAHTSESVSDKGFSIIADKVMENILKNDQSGKAYEYYLYKTIYGHEISGNKFLAEFSETRYQNIRSRFAELDREILTINAKQIAAKLANVPVPIGIGSGPLSTYTNKRLLVHEANKKTRHIPIRQLIKRSGEALKALKPCFLMSPISVAQYLAPGDIHFDLVVMDEASQLRPEDALGAIARADKSIIVGDPKQLPPTSFFDTSTSDDEEEATVIDDTEAILDVCLKQFPYRRLRWHYRSEHESLIQFSNEKFYDGDLIVFPSPKRDVRDYGVHFNYIDKPSYKKGRNRAEAEVVVENIIHHFHRHAEKSLGVAAINKAQAEEINFLLEKVRQKDPVVDTLISEQEHDEPLFIKNLENVQGDERDVIFISTTYGPEQPGGPVAQRFGPINSDLGWRRLNVIATRAKQRVESPRVYRRLYFLRG
ncbi:Superfamily I DNA and/or RNA helicase, partial [Nitrosomonas sp. Nm51]|uniref:DEAD/DEAH box helicase n=1 Tax=Nitrosomonas sp. Nm51 TaxID=133720 RepID=UPI0008BA05B6